MNERELFGLSVLYVEDDKETSKLTSEILETLFETLFIAFDGEEGLELYKKHKPDLIITDIILPELNGFDMLEEIKKINPLQYSIVISSFDKVEYMKKCISLQVSGFIQKPIKFKDFYAQMDKVITQIKNEKELSQNRQLLKEKDEMLIYQSKQAEIGELLSMITHQWKQPLNLISMLSSKNIYKMEFSEEKDINIENDFKEIMTQINYLSDTIDDFKEFLKPTKSYESLSVYDLIHKVETIVGKSLTNCDIFLEKCIDDIIINTYSKELIQVLINLINNSKDAFIQNKISNRKIKISANKNDDKLHLILEDNAGGIDENIVDKIFNQYFSTKKEDKGTGLGLYMAKNIIEKNLLGDIFVENDNNGLSTNILIPLAIKNEENN